MRPEPDALLPDDGHGSVVTVGTFDGVHLGHRAVLEEIARRARAMGRRAVLLTFDPHPLWVIRPEAAPGLLTLPEEKRDLLAESDLDYGVFLRFTLELSRYSPQQFVEEILVRRLGVRELVIGYDHGFGRGRSGDADTLMEIGRALGFAVDVLPPVLLDGEPISSTRIRRAVTEGDLAGARAGLGRPYGFRGRVVRGEGRGRKLGYPTANVEIASPQKLMPPPGVYAVRVSRRGGIHTGALHLGPRPTFEGAVPTLEVHLLDFDGDLYGQEIQVEWIEGIREVRPFPSVDALLEQLGRDVEAARQRVAAEGSPGGWGDLRG
jgi:riboflavin kinase / FMN adenylyltransferase